MKDLLAVLWDFFSEVMFLAILIIAYAVYGLLLALIYGLAVGGYDSTESFLAMIFLLPIASLVIIINWRRWINTQKSFRDTFEKTLDLILPGFVLYCSLPIIFNLASLLLAGAGAEKASAIIRDLRFISLVMVPILGFLGLMTAAIIFTIGYKFKRLCR